MQHGFWAGPRAQFFQFSVNIRIRTRGGGWGPGRTGAINSCGRLTIFCRLRFAWFCFVGGGMGKAKKKGGKRVDSSILAPPSFARTAFHREADSIR